MKLLISKLRLVSRCQQTNNVFRAMAYSNSSGKSNKIEFRSAYPSPSTLVKVSKYLERSTENLMKEDPDVLRCQAGSELGADEVRRGVADFLTRSYNSHVNKDELCITEGVFSTLHLIITHFFNESHTVFVEEPTYSFACKFLNDFPQTVKPKSEGIPLERDGINLEVLENKISRLSETETSKEHPFKAALFIMSVNHNPTGICYSAEKCKKVVELARKHNILVISDDVHNLLYYKKSDGKNFDVPPERLHYYDSKSDADYKGNVITLGSFSKILTSTVHVGWMESPDWIMRDVASRSFLFRANAGMSRYMSYCILMMIRNGDMEELVDYLKDEYSFRRDICASILKKRLFKLGFRFEVPQGGCVLWIKLPASLRCEHVLEQAKKIGDVDFFLGPNYSLEGKKLNFIRMPFVYYDREQLRMNVEQLCDIIEKILSNE